MSPQIKFLADNCRGGIEIVIQMIFSQDLKFGAMFNYSCIPVTTNKVYLTVSANRRRINTFDITQPFRPIVAVSCFGIEAGENSFMTL